MDTHFIFEKVQTMRPSSFSEEERHYYQAEKMMLRQFMLMKQQDQVPDYLSVRNMKTWLLTRRTFLEEFQEIIKKAGINHLYMAELAWTTARHFCLIQMEEELLEELDKEKQLSQLFSREVTLEGLQMFVSVIHPETQEDVQTFLPSLHNKLLRIFGGIQITSHQPSAGDTKSVPLLELEQSAALLVPKVVDIALRCLLEEPQRDNKNEVASAEIGKLLSNSAAPCLSKFGSVSKMILLGVCTTVAQLIVKAIYKRFDECSKSFHQMDYDESSLSAREGVISAIQDMDCELHTTASNQTHIQFSTSEGQEIGFLDKRKASLEVAATEELEERLLEEREASPQVSLDEELATIPNDVKEDTSLVILDNVAVHTDDELKDLQQVEVRDSEKEETLVQVSAIKNMDHKVQTAASTQGRVDLSTSEEQDRQILEKREASLEFAATEELKEGLLEEGEASSGVSVNEKVVTLQNYVTKNTSLYRLETNVIVYVDDELEELQQGEVRDSEKEETLCQDSAVKNMDHKVQTAASTQGRVDLSTLKEQENKLLEKREASLEFAATEELKEGLLEEREASPGVSVNEEVVTLQNYVTKNTTLNRLETNVIVYMDDELEELLQEDLRDSEKEETLVQDSTVQNMDHKMQTAASTDGRVDLSTSEEQEKQLLEKMEASLEFAATEELKEGLLEEREASPGVSVNEEVVTLQNYVTKNTTLIRLETNVIVYMDDELEELLQEDVRDSEKEETLVQDSSVQNMDHEMQTAASTDGRVDLSTSEEQEKPLLEKMEASLEFAATEELKEGLLEEREASSGVSVNEKVVTLQNYVTKNTTLYRLETNVIVYVDDELEELQQGEVRDSEKEETLVQDSTVQNMDHKMQTAASTDGRVDLSTSEEQEKQLLEKMEASLEFAATKELKEGLLEEREASPGVSVNEEVVTLQNYVTKNTTLNRLETNVIVYMDDELEELLQEDLRDSEKEETLVQDSSVQNTDHEMQTAASTEGRVDLSTSEEQEKQLLEKMEASLEFAATEELKEGLLEEREASPGVSVNEEMVTIKNYLTKNTTVYRLETNVIVYMDDELEVLKQEEVDVSETQEYDIKKKRKKVSAFFHGFWKKMTCCFHVSTEE